jgi:hypothetical protein
MPKKGMRRRQCSRMARSMVPSPPATTISSGSSWAWAASPRATARDSGLRGSAITSQRSRSSRNRVEVPAQLLDDRTMMAARRVEAPAVDGDGPVHDISSVGSGSIDDGGVRARADRTLAGGPGGRDRAAAGLGFAVGRGGRRRLATAPSDGTVGAAPGAITLNPSGVGVVVPRGHDSSFARLTIEDAATSNHGLNPGFVLSPFQQGRQSIQPRIEKWLRSFGLPLKAPVHPTTD